MSKCIVRLKDALELIKNATKSYTIHLQGGQEEELKVAAEQGGLLESGLGRFAPKEIKKASQISLRGFSVVTKGVEPLTF